MKVFCRTVSRNIAYPFFCEHRMLGSILAEPDQPSLRKKKKKKEQINAHYGY